MRREVNVALVGNMNGMFHSLYFYLQKIERINVELLSFEDDDSNFDLILNKFEKPSTKILNLTKKPSFFLKCSKKQIKNAFSPYDFIIGCGPTPAYLNRINRRLDIFVPYGSDLYDIPVLKLKRSFTIRKMISVISLRFHQKWGIKRAKHTLIEDTNEMFEKLIPFRLKNRIALSLPFGETVEIEDIKLKQQIKTLRLNNQILILHHCRHVWKCRGKDEVKMRMFSKGNDKFYKGLKLFIGKHPNIRIKVVTFENGIDFEFTKKLCDELKVSKNVIWLKPIVRGKILSIMSMFDAGVGELDHSFLSYGVVLELINYNLPVIAKRTDGLYKNYSNLYPILNVENEYDISLALEKIAFEKDVMKGIKVDAYRWYYQNIFTKTTSWLVNRIISD